jgi:hypothetical protein
MVYEGDDSQNSETWRLVRECELKSISLGLGMWIGWKPIGLLRDLRTGRFEGRHSYCKNGLPKPEKGTSFVGPGGEG